MKRKISFVFIVLSLFLVKQEIFAFTTCPMPSVSYQPDATLPSLKSSAGAKNKPITNISRNAVAKTIILTFTGGKDADDPTNFTAQSVSTSLIDLSWIKNAGRDVLLAWSSNGNFGEPLLGVIYSAGQSIPGGGIVLYAGSNTAYSHISLTAGTRYYYKIWTKVNSFPAWSTGVTADAATQTQTEVGAP